MKKILSLACLVVFWNCKPSDSTFLIEGTVPSTEYDDEWIYLVPLENPSFETVDSVRILNGSFVFSGKGEQMMILRMRPLLRLHLQELLVVTEPGVIQVKIDSVSYAKGTPQNDALQNWKEEEEKKKEAYNFIRHSLKSAESEDSLLLVEQFNKLKIQERDFNFNFLQTQRGNTVGDFVYKMVFFSLTEEQQEVLSKSICY